MDFDEPGDPSLVDGLPGAANAGEERFKGTSSRRAGSPTPCAPGELRLSRLRKFGDFMQEFDGVPTQLSASGSRCRPRSSARSAWLVTGAGPVRPRRGKYVGDRFLNQRNTAPADALLRPVGGGLGCRFERLRCGSPADTSPTERDPVAESELGDAQYYLLRRPRSYPPATASF